MLYIDYTWDVSPNGIILDEDLDIDRLGWQSGDYFRIVNRNGKVMLLKVDPLVKFIKEGENGQSKG